MLVTNESGTRVLLQSCTTAQGVTLPLICDIRKTTSHSTANKQELHLNPALARLPADL
jgi:hypothetical protein